MSSWQDICGVEEILLGTGVCALVKSKQVAIFHPRPNELYALSNFDPFSKAFVLSRGILGDRAGVLKVASPIYKQSFDLKTGQCLDDHQVRVETFPVRVREGRVEIETP
jgi:nitrite reductase (NADH) small subunit